MVQELFAECGADKAEDAPWLKLSEVHLSHNGLTELGISLVKYLKSRYWPGLMWSNFVYMC